MQDFSQLVQQRIQVSLPSAGITLTVVNILVWPRGEHAQVMIPLNAQNDMN